MDLKPGDCKKRIKGLVESIELGNAMIKNYLSFLDDKIYQKRLDEQQMLLDEIALKIDKIKNSRSNAIMDVGVIEQSQRYDKRQIIELENYAKIQKLKELIEKLKGETNGDANKDQQKSV